MKRFKGQIKNVNAQINGREIKDYSATRNLADLKTCLLIFLLNRRKGKPRFMGKEKFLVKKNEGSPREENSGF